MAARIFIKFKMQRVSEVNLTRKYLLNLINNLSTKVPDVWVFPLNALHFAVYH